MFIHGWNENSHAFDYIVKKIFSGADHERHEIRLADFITLDDSVTFTDLVEAMQYSWQKNKLPCVGKDVAVITHSTGALVLRAWLQRYYPQGGSPISNVIMLAPPNFGSHLAHKGRAFYGRILKGLGHSRPFEVGENLLLDLELASPYAWRLAMLDCFSENTSFHKDDILTTVFIGDAGYDGIASAANIPGSDGVVPIACANLMPQLLTINYEKGRPVFAITKPKSKVAFKILPGINHASILGDKYNADDLAKVYHAALNVTGAKFDRYCLNISRENELLFKDAGYSLYQQTVVKTKNQYGDSVKDYFVSFAEHMSRYMCLSEHFHNCLVASVHANSDNSSYRSFTMDADILFRAGLSLDTCIDFSIIGAPCLDHSSVSAGYRPHDAANSKALELKMVAMQQLFSPYSVLLVDWTILREHKTELFSIHREKSVASII